MLTTEAALTASGRDYLISVAVVSFVVRPSTGGGPTILKMRTSLT